MRVGWAKWMPSRGVDDGPRDTSKAALVLHTAVSTNAELNLPDSSRPGVGCHFYLHLDGSLSQYLDTDRYTGHAWDANHWSIGMESQDTGISANPGPWTQAQLDTIDHLCRELGIPALALLETPSNGLGYHRMFNSWNQSHHSCPGDAKVSQFSGIITRLKGDDDMTPEQAQQLEDIQTQLKDVHDFISSFKDAVGGGYDSAGTQAGRNAAALRGFRNVKDPTVTTPPTETYRRQGWDEAEELGVTQP